MPLQNRLNYTQFVRDYVFQLRPRPSLVVLDSLFHRMVPPEELRAFLRAFKEVADEHEQAQQSRLQGSGVLPAQRQPHQRQPLKPLKLVWLALGGKY